MSDTSPAPTSCPECLSTAPNVVGYRGAKGCLNPFHCPTPLQHGAPFRYCPHCSWVEEPPKPGGEAGELMAHVGMSGEEIRAAAIAAAGAAWGGMSAVRDRDASMLSTAEKFAAYIAMGRTTSDPSQP